MAKAKQAPRPSKSGTPLEEELDRLLEETQEGEADEVVIEESPVPAAQEAEGAEADEVAVRETPAMTSQPVDSAQAPASPKAPSKPKEAAGHNRSFVTLEGRR